MVYLEPVAIGFEYTGVWNQTEDTLNPYLYPDLDGSNGGEAYDVSDLVKVTLATGDFFGMSSDDPDREDEICEFYTYFESVSSDFPVEEFDWQTGVGGSGTSIGAWASMKATWSFWTPHLQIVATIWIQLCSQMVFHMKHSTTCSV